MGTILIIILILLLIGGLPVFPHSRSWGYGPSGIIGVVLVVLLACCYLQDIRPQDKKKRPSGASFLCSGFISPACR